MSYVKKVQKGTTEYDIHDTRVPEATSADEDKVLKVNASGQYELGEAGGGSGGGLYKHVIQLKYNDRTTNLTCYSTYSEPFTDSSTTFPNLFEIFNNRIYFIDSYSGDEKTYLTIFDSDFVGLYDLGITSTYGIFNISKNYELYLAFGRGYPAQYGKWKIKYNIPSSFNSTTGVKTINQNDPQVVSIEVDFISDTVTPL